MNTLAPFTERLQRAFDPSDRGVIGVVEELLGLCREGGLHLDWQADRCRVRRLDDGVQESTEIPLSKSVFRAILARLAVLCNERAPNSISPYGGEGELSLGTDPPMVFHVAFTNTPGEQRLEIRSAADAREESKDGNASNLGVWVAHPSPEFGEGEAASDA